MKLSRSHLTRGHKLRQRLIKTKQRVYWLICGAGSAPAGLRLQDTVNNRETFLTNPKTVIHDSKHKHRPGQSLPRRTWRFSQINKKYFCDLTPVLCCLYVSTDKISLVSVLTKTFLIGTEAPDTTSCILFYWRVIKFTFTDSFYIQTVPIV